MWQPMQKNPLLFVVLCIVSSTSQAATPGQEQKLPLVFIGLDSSGSMEYLETDGSIPLCNPPVYKKNRWAIAQEVLTGSFEQYTCNIDERIVPFNREDYGYPVPHVSYKFTTPQKKDGLIDSNYDRFKFAFGSFDTNFGTDTSASGGWSFGASVTIPGLITQLGLNSVNLGIRNADAVSSVQGGLSHTGGGLVGFPKGSLDGPPAALKEKADLVEAAIQNAIPYGGTPFAPFIEDIQTYFETAEELQPYEYEEDRGDPFYTCRSRNVLLISDGRPSMGEGEGYPTSVEAVANLYNSHPLGIKSFVVGYNLEDADDTAFLNDLASTGDPTNPEALAYIANNAQQLVMALSQVLGSILEGVKSRTLTVHTNSTRNGIDAQYQFNTSYGNTSVNSLDRQGFLEQDIYRCTESCKAPGVTGAQYCETFSISNKLNQSESSAPVYIVVDDEMKELAKDNDELTPDTLHIPADGGPADPVNPPIALLDLRPSYVLGGSKQILGSEILGYSNVEADRIAYKNQLIDFVLATPDSRRSGLRMGAIRHGTPSIIDRPKGTSNIPSYNLYREANINRPTVLFAPTHLGELMAFRIDRPNSITPSNYGEHLWSVIPDRLVGRIQENATKIEFLMDLSPVVRDVRLVKNGANADPIEELKAWRSVIVQGYREDRGYFALDVTDPLDPEFMWELSPDRRCYDVEGGISTCESNIKGKSNYCYLGDTTSRPTLGHVFLNSYNGVGQQERAVALFGGGSYDEVPGAKITCGSEDDIKEEEIGRVFYVTDLKTGEKIAEFRPENGNIVGKDGATSKGQVKKVFKYDIVGTPACFNPSLGATVSRCFVGDAGGQLWRVDLSSGNPADWRMSFFHDAYANQPNSVERSPLFEAPTLALQGNTGKLVVLYGTGDIDQTEALGTNHSVYSLVEEVSLNSGGGINDTTDIIAKENWSLQFSDGTSVMGTPIVFDEVAYFVTFRLDPENACSVADDAGRLYGVNYINSDSEDPDVPGEPLPAMDEDGDVLTTEDTVQYITLPPGVPYGVRIIQRPGCAGESPLNSDSPSSGADSSSASGEIEQGSVELVVQYEKVGESDTDANAPQVATVKHTIARPSTTLTGFSWSLIFD